MTTQDTLATVASGLLDGSIKVVDCTAPLGPDTPLLKLPPELADDTPKIEIHKISEYGDRGPWWAWNWLKLGEHSGTHFDAPHHWITGKDYPDGSVDTINPQNFVAPANVIDCSKEAAQDPDFLLTVEHVKAWEAEHGEIKEGEWVLMRTDWSKRVDPVSYVNANHTGQHTPGPSTDAIRFLVEERDVLGFGSESIGTDAGQADHLKPPYPCHSLMHGAGKWGLQCLTNLDQLPATGAVLVTPPLKILNGSGSPLRVLALVDA